MQQKQTKTQLYLTVVLLSLSMALWLVGCTPDEDVVEVTVRPTVALGGTAVTLSHVKDCADQPEYLGLNWRTLEVLPWSEVID